MSSSATVSVGSEPLGPLWAAELDPLFWRQLPTEFPGGGYAHVPFAFWVVGAAEPGILVQLGAQVAYFAFCEAVRACGLKTLCYAVDAWKGNTGTRLYPAGVYEEMRRYNDARYPAFSELLQCTFDEARAHFADGSVDLLNINGVHSCDAVRHEVEAWRPRLSNRAVVLLHNINVRRDDFGASRVWEELRSSFPSFEFLHGNGLGVLAVGSSPPAKVAALCALRDPVKLQAVRERFSFLGERWELRHKLDEVSRQEKEVAAAHGQVASLENARKHLQAALAERDSRIVALETELAAGRMAAAEAARQSAAEAHLRARAAERATQARAETTRALVRTAGLPGPPASFLSANIRFVYISGEPDTPGHLYRVIRPMEACKALGVETSWMRVTEIPQRLKEVAAAHVLVIWRAGWEERLATAVETAHRSGARVVFDVDDLMVDPELARLEIIDGIRTQGLTEGHVQDHYARFHTTMLAADFCTAPTEELARHLRRFFRPTLVLPNGFDHATYRISRRAVRRRRAVKPDGCIRIGYASGTRTHQRDFAVAAEAIAQVLRDRPQCRLVLFRDPDTAEPSLDPGEFASLRGLGKQIEWRDLVPLPKLPGHLAEFDINLAPLEVGNPFCEAKSELKFVEASLVDVPTIASPTGPYRRAIRDSVTGFLAEGSRAWHQILIQLVDDAGMRHRIARAAHQDVLWRFGPLRRADLLSSALPQFQAVGRQASRAFALELARAGNQQPPKVNLPPCEVVFEANA
ncbi:MAG TPA: class I SAM-dependent methyltransferase, partial [Chthoniobacterales bacterium]